MDIFHRMEIILRRIGFKKDDLEGKVNASIIQNDEDFRFEAIVMTLEKIIEKLKFPKAGN